jgi:diguanylate cyclase (GGDEF)-like protein/PAS domain S-box-containing protein
MKDLLDAVSDGVYIVDSDRKVVFWNAAAERITGFTSGDVLGKRCADNILIHVDESGRSLCSGCCPLSNTLDDSEPRRARVFLHHRDGHRVAVDIQTLSLFLEDGTKVGVEIFGESGSAKSLRNEIDELRRLSLADPLTGLPNRRQMEAVLSASMAAMKRNGIPFGVLFVDIDNFKAANDRYGHAAGDRVLSTIARTLVASVRPFDVVGRWGGEEFLGVFPMLSARNLVEIAERLRHLVEATTTMYEGTLIPVTVSIGATAASLEDSENSVVDRADALMYKSKQLGRNRVTSG